MISILEVKNKKQLKQFATFPVRLYKSCKYYVPSFISDDFYIYDKKKNLSLGNSEVKCFLAIKDKKVVGRIAGIICHDSNKKNDEKCIRFSRFDFIDDIEVSSKLLDAVMEYGREKGMNTIHGPWGFNDTDREGMLTFGFDEYSTYATAYSFPYYIEHMEKLDFKKESEWVEYRVDLKNIDPRIKKITSYLKEKRNLHLVDDKLSLKEIIKRYGDSFFDCYNKSYYELDNYIPIEGEAKQKTLEQFGKILNKKYFSLILNDMDKVVGFCIGLPYIGDVLRKSKGRMILAAIPLLWTIKYPKKIELALMGADPEYQNYALFAIVMESLSENLKKYKIQDVYMNPILTTNFKMNATANYFNKSLRAKRQTYKKKIDMLEDYSLDYFDVFLP